jgi:hypothetical protein
MTTNWKTEAGGGSVVTVSSGYVNVLNTNNNVTVSLSDLDYKLRQIARSLEPSATSDIRQRQRIVIDGVGTGTTGITTETAGSVPVTFSGTTLVSGGALGVSVAGGGQAPLAAPPYVIGTVVYQPVWEGPVDQRWRVAEDSHVSYQTGIRSHLSFT